MQDGVCFVANPAAGSSRLEDIEAFISANPGSVLRLTEHPEHGRVLAAEARDAGFATIVAVGGDGTVGEVVAGLADAPGDVVLGIVPCGTGNDLCRTLGIPLDPAGALAAIDTRDVRTIDLVRATFGDRPPLWGVNMAVGGVAGEVGDRVDPDLKKRWGPLAYVAEGIKAAMEEIPRHVVRVAIDADTVEANDVIAAIVGNGRTCGGGRRASPLSSLEDGLLDLILVQSGSVLDFAELMARLVAGDYTRSDLVSHRRGRRISLTSEPSMRFNLDGELVGPAPVTFEVVPGALKVIAGPEYCATVEG